MEALRPKVASFVISFVIIGVYWLTHHRYFEYVRSYDNPLLLINLLYLLFVAALSATTNLHGAFHFVTVAVVIYAAFFRHLSEPLFQRES